jgi:hypothetical protein
MNISGESVNQMKIRSVKIRTLFGIFLRLVTAVAFSLLITRLTLDFSGLDFKPWPQLAAAVIVSVLFSLIAWSWKSALAFVVLSGTAAMTGWISGYFSSVAFDRSIANASFWLVEAFYWLISQPNFFPESAKPDLALVIGILIATGCFWLIARNTQPWLMLAVIIILVMIRQHLGMITSILILSVALLLIIIAFALKQTGLSKSLRKKIIQVQPTIARQAFVVALVTVLIASIISTTVPAAFFSSPANFLKANNRTQGISIFNSIYGTQTAAGIEYAGYYPLQNRLGGPVNISSEPVLLVNAGRQPMLLKGAVSGNYTGFSWQRLPTDGSYQYGSSLWLDYFRYIYNLDLPDQETTNLMNSNLDSGLHFAEAQYDVTHLVNGLRSIYHEGKPLEVNFSDDGILNLLPDDIEYDFKISTGSDKNIYFNEGGVLFRKTKITKSNRYTIKSNLLNIDENKFLQWYKAALKINAEEVETRPDRVLPSKVTENLFLQLPKLPEYMYGGEIDNLTQSIIKDYSNSYEKALAIRNHLRTSNNYSLDVEAPPDDREFVSWFLEQGEGYCVYFATALTMMCRLAGIPARYVEGYWLPPAEYRNSDSPDAVFERVVTGQQAHAWTEIYLENIGWIALDATPGGGEAFELEIDSESTSAVISDTGHEVSKSVNVTDNTSISEDSTNIPGTDADNSKDSLASPEKLILIIILIITFFTVIIVYFIRYRLYKMKSREDWWIKKSEDVSERVKLILPDILMLLRWSGHSRPDNQSWSRFAQTFSAEQYGMLNWNEAVICIEKVIYGNESPGEGEWMTVWDSYKQLILFTKNRKPRLYWLFVIIINS